MRRHGIRFDRPILDLDDYQSQVQFRSAALFRTTIGNKFAASTWLSAIKWWRLCSFRGLMMPWSAQNCTSKNCAADFPGVRWHVVPNTVVEPQFRLTGSDRFTFLFVGRMDYLPNWDAILFFCMHLRRMTSRKFRVLVVGRAGSASDLHRLTVIEDIRVVLDPSDLSPYYAQSDVAIVPHSERRRNGNQNS